MIFKILKCALDGEAIGDVSGLDREAWGRIYSVSKKHDLAHIVGYVLSSSQVEIDEDIRKTFEKVANMAAFRYVKRSYELDAIKGALSSAQIPFLPLKGSVISEYYKEPWLRTSCDIDVLVKKEDLEKAKCAIIDTLGYELQPSSTMHDVSLMSPSGVHLELHFELKEELFKESKALTEIWQGDGILPASDYEYKMTNEMFLFYHIYHMAKHFQNGGCGIKPILDLWIIKNKMGYDEEKAIALLQDEGYLLFYKNALDLMDVWLDGKEHTLVTKNMERYILNGGVYGSTEQNIVMAQNKRGGVLKNLWHRIFMPYKLLVIKYPSLKKCPPLYPVYLIIRWFGALFGRNRGLAFEELRANQKISQEERDAAKKLNEQLGL